MLLNINVGVCIYVYYYHCQCCYKIRRSCRKGEVWETLQFGRKSCKNRSNQNSISLLEVLLFMWFFKQQSDFKAAAVGKSLCRVCWTALTDFPAYPSLSWIDAFRLWVLSMLFRIQRQLQQWKSSLLTTHAAEVVSADFLSPKHSTLGCEQLFGFSWKTSSSSRTSFKKLDF